MIRASSFRDPSGAVFVLNDRIFRQVFGESTPVLRDFLESDCGRKAVESRKIVRTVEVAADRNGTSNPPPPELDALSASDCAVFEHERIWFPSYPYEWPAEMLYAAGQLTIDLAQSCLSDAFGLKDATPYNILFSGPKPVFVDVLSFEKRAPGDPRWLAYGQFLRTFILPLLVNREFGMTTAELFLPRRDGIEPEDVYRLTSWAQRLRPEFLSPVSIPAWLSGRAESAGEQLYQTRKLIEPEKANFILRAQIHRAGKQLGRVEPKQQRTSTWSSYTRTLSYAAEDFKRKSDLVRTWLTRNRPASVLDIGCNTGHFSDLAAETGAQVVAIDTDPVVVGSLWARAAEQNLSILPLIVNFAWPTPGVGWRNEECPSFLARATGRFETVMMLAVLHHVIVTERVPLEQIVDVCDSLTTRNVIVEYVSREDEMFRRLTRGREALYRNFTQEHFENAFGARFQILEKQALKGELRWLYLLEKKVA